MTKNIGSSDKIIRLTIAVIIAILYFTNVLTGLLGTIMIIIAILLAVTALVGFCPLYVPLGINTNKKKRQ